MAGDTREIAQPSAAAPSAAIYSADELSAELRQCEILSNVRQWLYDGGQEVSAIIHKFCVIVTQDCDLLWDYESRQASKTDNHLSGVLLFEAENYETKRFSLGAGTEPKNVARQNKNERWQFLPTVPAECDCSGTGIPELLIDFKRFFTLPPQELYRQCQMANGAVRRTRLLVPYREHLQARAAFFMQRVSLP